MINKEIAFKFGSELGEILFFANQSEFECLMLANSVVDKSYLKFLSYSIALDILNKYKSKIPSICFLSIVEGNTLEEHGLPSKHLEIETGEFYCDNSELIDKIVYSGLILPKVGQVAQQDNTGSESNKRWLSADFEVLIPHVIASVKLGLSELQKLNPGDTLLLDVY